MVDHTLPGRENPVLEAFRTDPERAERWIIDEYLRALDEYKNHPEREFDEDGDLRLATYHRVSRCGATAAQVDEAITTLNRMDPQQGWGSGLTP